MFFVRSKHIDRVGQIIQSKRWACKNQASIKKAQDKDRYL